MLASEAIALLKSAELKQLGVKTDSAAILGFINLGILEIHKRFPLWEAEATIVQADGVSLYSLDGTDPNVTMDLSDHEFLVVDRVYDEDDLRYTINNDKDPDSLSILKPQQIKVATVVPLYTMEVVYRASPKFLTVDTQTIPLPIQFMEALFLYAGYKGQTSIKSGAKDENNTHYTRFEAECNRVKREGLYAQDDMESKKFETRGFV